MHAFPSLRFGKNKKARRCANYAQRPVVLRWPADDELSVGARGLDAPPRQAARTPTSVPAPNVGDVLDSPIAPEGHGEGEVLWGVVDEGVAPAPLVAVRHLLLHQRHRFGIGELVRSIIGRGGTAERPVLMLREARVV